MNPWLQKLIDTNFRDFEGLSISGQIPVKDQVLNELLADALRQAQQPAAAPPSTDKPDLRPFLKLVKKAEVRAVNGAIVLDFQVGV
jgi:hypothetical protein